MAKVNCIQKNWAVNVAFVFIYTFFCSIDSFNVGMYQQVDMMINDQTYQRVQKVC